MGKPQKHKNNHSKPKHTPSTTSSHFTSYQQIDDKINELREDFQLDKAIQLLQGAIQSNAFPNEAHKLYDLLGEVYLDMADETHAKQCFEQSVAIRPQEGFSKFMYLGQLCDCEDAVHYFKQGIQNMLQMKQQNSYPNIDELNHMISNGCCSIIEIFMTDLCFEPNAESECDTMLQLAIKENPNFQNDSNLLQTMASFKMSQNKPEEAKQCMQRVVQLVKQQLQQSETNSMIERPSYDFRIGTAKILMELSQFETAEEVLDQLALEFEKVVDLWYLLGVCSQQLKQYKTSMDNFEKALELGKKTKEDAKFLREIEEELRNTKELYQKAVQSGQIKEEEQELDTVVAEKEEDWEDVDSDSDDEDHIVLVDKTAAPRKGDYFDEFDL